MKTIKSFIIVIYIVSFLTSCSEDETVYETVNSEINATGDKGDVTGDPNGRSTNLIIKDFSFDTSRSTGDKGDITGGPNSKNSTMLVKDSIINTSKSTGDKGDVTGDPNN